VKSPGVYNTVLRSTKKGDDIPKNVKLTVNSKVANSDDAVTYDPSSILCLNDKVSKPSDVSIHPCHSIHISTKLSDLTKAQPCE
jgi:hypothetical protein